LIKQKKDILILGVGKVLQVVISLVAIRILTEVLSEQEVGNYYLLITILTLFNFALLNPLGQYFERHLIHWKQSQNLLNATNVLLFLRFMAVGISMFIALIVYEIFEYDRYYSLNEFLLFIFISLIAGTYGVLLNAVNVLGDRVRFIIYAVATLTVGLVLSLFILYFIDKSAIGWLYGIAISQLIFSIGLYKYVIKNNDFSVDKIKSAFSKKYIKKIVIFIIPVTITLFLQWGQNISYRFIVEDKYSLELLAYIGVGLSVSGAIFSAVESLATQYYSPIYLREITNATKEERTKAWNNLASYMIPIYLLLALYIVSLSSYLTQVLVAEKFHEAYIYAMFGAGVEFFRVITNLVYLVSQSEIKTNNTILPYAIGFMFTISTLYFFDMSDKLWMIPLFLAISNSVIFLILFINMRKLLDITIDVVDLVKLTLFATPMLLILLLNYNNSMIQAFLTISISGIYLLFIIYLVIQKKVIRVKSD